MHDLLDLDRLITVLFQQLTTMMDHEIGDAHHKNTGFWNIISLACDFQSLSFIFQCGTSICPQKCEKYIYSKSILTTTTLIIFMSCLWLIVQTVLSSQWVYIQRFSLIRDVGPIRGVLLFSKIVVLWNHSLKNRRHVITYSMQKPHCFSV